MKIDAALYLKIGAALYFDTWGGPAVDLVVDLALRSTTTTGHSELTAFKAEYQAVISRARAQIEREILAILRREMGR